MASERPRVNVGTIGHIDHGKTTLTAALIPVLRRLQEEAMQEAQPDQVKIAIVSDGTDPKVIARMAAALIEKGYVVVDEPEQATHVLGQEGIRDFVAAERRAVKVETERVIGRSPWMKARAKAVKKAKMRELQRRAFTGE